MFVLALSLHPLGAQQSTSDESSGTPCEGDTVPSGALWTACLTAGTDEAKQWDGYVASSIGNLSPDTFTLDGITYTIDQILDTADNHTISFTSDPSPASNGWYFKFVNLAFAFSRATGPDASYTFSWSHTGVDWHAGDKVTVSLWPSQPPRAPGPPTNLTANAASTSRIDLSWSEPLSDGRSPISHYWIEYASDGTNFSDLISNTGSVATAYADIGLTANTTRHYQVSAVNSVGRGLPSNVASATTTNNPQQPPPQQPPQQPTTTNHTPEAAEPIGEQAVEPRAAVEIALPEAFYDADGDTLEYMVESSDSTVAIAGIDGAALVLRGVHRGIAEIILTATDPHGGFARQTFSVVVDGPERIWYLPSASDPLRDGYVRVENHSKIEIEATVAATDDAGSEYGPLTLALGPRQVRHFNSDDLERGNAAKGLIGATGSGTGAWRLTIDSAERNLEALSYVGAANGHLAALGMTVPMRPDGSLAVAIFNPASELDQTSLLRLVNPGGEDAEVTVVGVDDAGRSPGEPVRLTVPAATSCTVNATQLESGSGLPCGVAQEGLGNGSGRWRLRIESTPPLVAMSLLTSPEGHLANLSGVAAEDPDGTWRVPLFPAMADEYGRQGFVRIANRSPNAGDVLISAFDDGDTEYEPLTLEMGSTDMAHLDANALELGSSNQNMTGSTGAGTGIWRLAMSSQRIKFEANDYVRHADGFLTSMQARAPESNGVHRVPFFNSANDADSTSVLRLVNPTENRRLVRITGTDDTGVRPGTTVRLWMEGGDAMELTAAELESGESTAPGLIDEGALGDGSGKWRLRVDADDIVVLNLVVSATGRLTNLSYADRWRGFKRTRAAPLPPPATVTLDSPRRRELRGSWSEVPNARYRVHVMKTAEPNYLRSLGPYDRTMFRWSGVSPATYTIRVCSLNEDGACGAWSEESDPLAID
ncbi:MAG: fibronectin type III domain-containing protein [Gammaproteobacteria bacterium]|nr:fibronectin type III domain-containing protein [Gammaproteobacteria bacterium]